MTYPGICEYFKDTLCEVLLLLYAKVNGKDKPIINNICGTLLRTKQAQVTEGGVATGYAVLDSIVLSNDQ